MTPLIATTTAVTSENKKRCPECNNDHRHIAKHLRNVHGWSFNSSKNVSNILGIRKVAKDNSLITGIKPKRLRVNRRTQYPIGECTSAVTRLKQHVVKVHGSKAFSDLRSFQKRTLSHLPLTMETSPAIGNLVSDTIVGLASDAAVGLASGATVYPASDAIVGLASDATVGPASDAIMGLSSDATMQAAPVIVNHAALATFYSSDDKVFKLPLRWLHPTEAVMASLLYKRLSSKRRRWTRLFIGIP